VQAWQTDNEYGDHDTIYSYSEAALHAFRDWLKLRYGTISELNRAWGTSFWSMTYSDFAQIDLPNNLVDEPTPSHLVDFTRFSSDQVRAFNKAQVDLLRQHAPGRPITHNFMNQNTDFDHYALGKDIDVASWDVYPLGGLTNGRLSDADKARFLRVGDPDQTAFNHDLYRAVGRGRVWVMEQQPGPVNWAAYNQAPADGMVRLWTWLAFAHGVDMVSYFRWRQAPFAQEQFHAGLLLPDSTPDQGHLEVAQVAREKALLPAIGPRAGARVALVLDYESRWASRSLPQGANYRPHHIALDWYAAASRLGVDLDIIGQHSDLEGYDLVLAPDLLIPTEAFVAKLQSAKAKVLFGPRSGSKTADMHIPETLPPGPLAALLNIKVTRVESLPDYAPQSVIFGNAMYQAARWRETVVTTEQVLARFDGTYQTAAPALIGNDKARYLATLPGTDLLAAIIEDTLKWSGLQVMPDLGDLRMARRDVLHFAFNFGHTIAEVPAAQTAKFLIGERMLAPVGVAIWTEA
jgi:beta-galactosidase